MKLLVKRYMDPMQDPDSRENRARIGMLAGWVGTVASLCLTVAKGWVGFVSGSISLIADATNSLADVGSSLVIALGFHWSRKPQDEHHPFGHGRIEAVATLVLSLALLLVGFEVAKSGVMRLLNPKQIEAPFWVLVVVAVTVGVKVWMAVFSRNLAKMAKSQVLKADAWNHTYDVVCTLLVVVALICAQMGFPSLDGWTAIGVSAFILFTGVQYAREAIDILLGVCPDPEDIVKIHETVETLDEVLGVHEIMVHQYGEVRMVSFHIEVDAKMTLNAAHLLAEKAETAVETKLGWRAVAHVDPVDRSHPMFKELHQVLSEYIKSDDELIDFHDLRAVGELAPYQVSFDLVTDTHTRSCRYSRVYQDTLKLLDEKFAGKIKVAEIGIEAAVDSCPMERKKFHLFSE